MRAYATGVCATEAAVELLIRHRRWLTRADFVDAFVTVWPADPMLGGDVSVAQVDWPAAVAALDAGVLACSRGEAAMLRIAASLAGTGAVDLGRAVTCLDEVNLVLVGEAVAHAGGLDAWRVPFVLGMRVQR